MQDPGGTVPPLVFRICDTMMTDLSSKGTSALVDVEEKAGETFPWASQYGRNACSTGTPFLASRRHCLRRARASSGGGLVPQECGGNLPRSAALQPGAQ